MHTEAGFDRLAALAGAVALVVAILVGAPAALPEDAARYVHFTAFSALTWFLWRAMDGELPLLVLGAAAAFAALGGAAAIDVLANASGVAVTGALLWSQREKPCAESSPR
ncbi:MAG TPA: hypothetical protein VM489_05145 [Burkholderiales bacterium]|nr:hypothetical protein [Burkholderiales bacterium]